MRRLGGRQLAAWMFDRATATSHSNSRRAGESIGAGSSKKHRTYSDFCISRV